VRQRTAILHDRVFLGHDTGNHVERAARIAAIDTLLQRERLLGDRPRVSFTPAPDDAILRVHTPGLLHALETIAARGGAWIDADTVVQPDSLDQARLAVGGALNAVEALLDGRIDRAFVIARPPGHHATPTRAMGFCLLNTAAIAAAHAIAHGAQRVAILDWDVHHGNGTQDAFYGRGDVFYCSLHQWPFYPGTGLARETGSGPGGGTTLNIPLAAGTDGATYLEVVRREVIPALDRFAPDLVIVSAGYDAHEDDPLGALELTDDDFDTLMRESTTLADRHGGRLLVVLEGGYDVDALARCVAGAITVLDEPQGPLPAG
jgi:acetoin utilization deacetylase AcuC-like enzyme